MQAPRSSPSRDSRRRSHVLNQGRVDAVINDSIAVYAYLAEKNDSSVKIAATTGDEE